MLDVRWIGLNWRDGGVDGRMGRKHTMSANNSIRTQKVSLCIRSSVLGPLMSSPSCPHIVV